MSNIELTTLIKETNHLVDILYLLNNTYADDFLAKENLEKIKEQKKALILENIKNILSERPNLYKKCFSSKKIV